MGFLSKLQKIQQERAAEGQQSGPKGFLGKFLNSSKLDAGRRNALMGAMNATASTPGAGGSMMGRNTDVNEYRKGGKAKATKKMAKGGSTASKRADGCAVKGKTKGRFV